MSMFYMHQLKHTDCQSGSKNKTTVSCLEETHFKYKDTYRIQVNGWRKIYQANTNQKKAGIAILILDKVDFRARKMLSDKNRNYITIMGSALQEHITILKGMHLIIEHQTKKGKN